MVSRSAHLNLGSPSLDLDSSGERRRQTCPAGLRSKRNCRPFGPPSFSLGTVEQPGSRNAPPLPVRKPSSYAERTADHFIKYTPSPFFQSFFCSMRGLGLHATVQGRYLPCSSSSGEGKVTLFLILLLLRLRRQRQLLLDNGRGGRGGSESREYKGLSDYTD